MSTALVEGPRYHRMISNNRTVAVGRQHGGQGGGNLKSADHHFGGLGDPPICQLLGCCLPATRLSLDFHSSGSVCVRVVTDYCQENVQSPKNVTLFKISTATACKNANSSSRLQMSPWGHLQNFAEKLPFRSQCGGVSGYVTNHKPSNEKCCAFFKEQTLFTQLKVYDPVSGVSVKIYILTVALIRHYDVKSPVSSCLNCCLQAGDTGQAKQGQEDLRTVSVLTAKNISKLKILICN